MPPFSKLSHQHTNKELRRYYTSQDGEPVRVYQVLCTDGAAASAGKEP